MTAALDEQKFRSFSTRYRLLCEQRYPKFKPVRKYRYQVVSMRVS